MAAGGKGKNGWRWGPDRVSVTLHMSSFPLDLTHRPRRLRRNSSVRALVEETVLRPADFIAPLFVVDGKGEPEPIASMPGVLRFNVADLVKECRALAKLGVPAVALFPKLDKKFKNDAGTAALDEDALILRAVRAVNRCQEAGQAERAARAAQAERAERAAQAANR